jgi:thiosulfate reductase cytochrome b subunit
MLTTRLNLSRSKLFILGLMLLVLAFALSQTVVAQDGEDEVVTETAVLQTSLHPTFPLLDEDGSHVLDSGKPVSTMQTCNECHDAEFIASHSFHADVGLSAMTEPGETGNGRAWDTSPGLFGKWNPITYRYLSPFPDANTDLTTADWVKVFGVRHAGGGPAQYSQDGTPLTELTPNNSNIEASIVDPETGELVPWDWAESGIVEMNCFLCHMPNPDNEARQEAIHTGNFGWANSATLQKAGIISQDGDNWTWNADAFDENGELVEGIIAIQDPTNDNCGQCHGLVHVDAQTPMILSGCTPEQWTTITTGQIMSPQKIAESGINIENKAEIRRSWDIHTERVVKCTDCHYSLNNPVYYQELTESRPEHLDFDPRRIDLGEYLYRPLHEFAKGQSAQGALAPSLDNTIRTCADCHEAQKTHNWLPYADRHMTALACESCHIPEMFGPARQSYDWTVVHTTGEPQVQCRGVEGGGETFATALVSGYEPVLLPRPAEDGTAPLSPHNLITSWYWVYGSPERPVPERDLQAAWLDGDSYHADIIDVFDANSNGVLEESELIIDSERKEVLIAGNLEALGLENPRIAGEIQPYNINHNVTHGEWATKECQTCHGEDSRVTRPMLLADKIPGDVMPTFVSNGTTVLGGDIVEAEDGTLYYEPKAEEADLYVLGHNSVKWIDLAGALIFLGTIAGVFTHGGLRYWASRRNPPHEAELREVYMYTIYERLWHWLQTAVILLLTFTGLIIHKPDLFGAFSFSYMVQVHNVLAAILIANAALALFYNLASGEIRQYLPQPQGFFNQMTVQALFYLRGIFKGEEHPFEKTPENKLNPLQQVTYLGLLNVLLPLQIITGILMWGAQRWPDISAQLGGLPFLAPFHTMVAWLFATFVVMHVYLTTTGPTPMANIKAMMMGWDEVEVHQSGAAD